ncbi:MAG: thymidylate synthase [Candidatus Sericytochromatia bacterium]
MTNKLDLDYIELLKDIKENGYRKQNRTGVDTISSFSKSLRVDLTEGFPLLTTKKVFFRGVFEEMQMFLKGETDTKKLEEKGVNYWKGNTSREFLDQRNLDFLPEGEMGCGYGHQFRNFGGEHPFVPQTKGLKGVDQLANVIEKINTNPWDRRIIISLWCPTQLDYAALPPCHLYTQFYCNPDKKEISCFLLMRSSDLFLGLPTNLIQYALLTHYIAKICGYTAKELYYNAVDAHIYVNHLDKVNIQIERKPYPLPELIIKKEVKTLDDVLALNFEDIEIKNYQSHSALKADMAV